MRFAAIIYIFFSFLSSSVLELYGTGERRFHIEAAGLGLGETYYFSDNKSRTIGTSISTYWKSNLTRVSYSNRMTKKTSGYIDGDIYFSSFTFTLPISKYNGCSIGLTPYTRSDIIINESDGYLIGPGVSDAIEGTNSYSDYKVSGGISSVYLAFSSKINKNNSFGFKFDRLFGNQFKTKKTIISEFGYSSSGIPVYTETDSTYKIVSNEFKGFTLQFDWMFHNKNHEFLVSATSIGPLNINTKTYFNEYTSLNPYSNDNTFLVVESMDDLIKREPDYEYYIEDDIASKDFVNHFFDRINDYAIGYHYLSENFGVIVEYHANDLFQNTSLKEVNIFNYAKPSSCSYHLGLHKNFTNKKIGVWDSIYLRAGGYYKELSSSNLKGNDFAVTLGIGIDKSSNLIDLGIKFGKLNIDSFQSESYVDAILSIQIGNRWFENSRSKND